MTSLRVLALRENTFAEHMGGGGGVFGQPDALENLTAITSLEISAPWLGGGRGWGEGAADVTVSTLGRLTALQRLLLWGCDAAFVHACGDALAPLRLKTLGVYFASGVDTKGLRVPVPRLPHLRRCRVRVPYNFSHPDVRSPGDAMWHASKETARMMADLPDRQNIDYFASFAPL